MSVATEANAILESTQWSWIEKYLLGALEEKSLLMLKNAKSEEERMLAQQLFIASRTPKELLERLIGEGKAAKIALQEISTLKESENV